MQEYSDIEIFRAVTDGNVEIFKEIVKRYGTMVYNLCYRLTGNDADARDLTHDVFIHALKATRRFRNESSVSTWLHKIAVNNWINISKRRKRIEFFSLDKGMETEDDRNLLKTLPDSNLDVDKYLQKREIEDIVQKQLEELSPDHRLMIVLRYVDGKSYEEISKICQCSIGTVGSRLSRALGEFKKNLKGIIEE